MLRIIGGYDMIEMKELTLESFLYKAIEQVKTTKNMQLISWTNQINSCDMISVFQAAEKMKQDRIFWTNNTKDFIVVGIGSVHKLIAHEDRYRTLQNEWNAILRQTVIHNPFKEA